MPGSADARTFRSTLWSVVLRAGNPSLDSPEALEKLCRTYWFPLYAFVRRKGFSEQDAQDLTQAFFGRLLSKQALAQVGPEKGRFRTFLLCSMNNFLANEWDRARTLKRGGNVEFVSRDELDFEERYQLGSPESSTPDQLFDRRWAEETMALALGRLRTEFEGSGKDERFGVLKGFLAGNSEFSSYAEAAAHLGVSEQAIKGAVLRLRRRLGELLREQIEETIDDPKLIDQELRHLLSALAG